MRPSRVGPREEKLDRVASHPFICDPTVIAKRAVPGEVTVLELLESSLGLLGLGIGLGKVTRGPRHPFSFDHRKTDAVFSLA
jgi:hypothetical protein